MDNVAAINPFTVLRRCMCRDCLKGVLNPFCFVLAIAFLALPTLYIMTYGPMENKHCQGVYRLVPLWRLTFRRRKPTTSRIFHADVIYMAFPI